MSTGPDGRSQLWLSGRVALAAVGRISAGGMAQGIQHGTNLLVWRGSSAAGNPGPAHAPMSVCVDVLEIDLAGDDDDGASTAGVKASTRFIIVPASATAGELLNAVLNPREALSAPGTASPSEVAAHSVSRRGKTKLTALGPGQTVLENYNPNNPRATVGASAKLVVASKRIDAQAWLRTQVGRRVVVHNAYGGSGVLSTTVLVDPATATIGGVVASAVQKMGIDVASGDRLQAQTSAADPDDRKLLADESLVSDLFVRGGGNRSSGAADPEVVIVANNRGAAAQGSMVIRVVLGPDAKGAQALLGAGHGHGEATVAAGDASSLVAATLAPGKTLDVGGGGGGGGSSVPGCLSPLCSAELQPDPAEPTSQGWEVVVPMRATVAECLLECRRIAGVGLDGDGWHLCSTNWAGDLDKRLNEPAAGLRAAGVFSDSTVLLEAGQLTPKGSIRLTVHWRCS